MLYLSQSYSVLPEGTIRKDGNKKILFNRTLNEGYRIKFTETFVGMICVMMNISNYAENVGKLKIIMYVLIDLKRKTRENIEFVMKAKTHLLNVFRRRSLFKVVEWSLSDQFEFSGPMRVWKLPLILFRVNKCCIELKGGMNRKKLNGLVPLQNQVKALRLQDKLRNQNFLEDKEE